MIRIKIISHCDSIEAWISDTDPECSTGYESDSAEHVKCKNAPAVSTSTITDIESRAASNNAWHPAENSCKSMHK